MISGGFVDIKGGTFIQDVGCGKKGQELLAKAASPNAFHNSNYQFDPPKCHENTRVAVLNKIQNWIQFRESVEYPIMWLYGGAGAGKSAIARTIAEWCQEKGCLISSFFFCRADTTRNHARSFVASLAYSITQSVPETRPPIEFAVENDRHIFSLNLDTQFTKLVYEPFKQVTQEHPPHVIIVDGLDECSDEKEQEALLRLFVSIFHRYHCPSWKLLVASRKEQTISLKFDDDLWLKTTRLALNNDYSSHEDIKQFLDDEITEIKLKHPLKQFIPANWPGRVDINTLAQKSSGHFIFASTAIRYIKSHRHSPVARLKLVMDACSPGSSAANALPFAELDRLYTHIFSSVGVENVHLARRLIALIILYSRFYVPPDTEACAKILRIATEEVALIYGELGSIIERQHDIYYVLHASLEDYLFDQHRAGMFWMDRNLIYIDILHSMMVADNWNWKDLKFDGLPILGDMTLSQESCEYFVGLIDFRSMKNNPKGEFGQESVDFICEYLEYLKEKVSVGIFSA